MTLTTFLVCFFYLILSTSAQSPSNAPEIANNPRLATFQAILQASKPIQGTITGVSATNGSGVDFNVNFFSFPDPSVGPYAYHIHVNPIPEDGNCTAAGGHLDPYNVTDAYKCPGSAPDVASTCQLGDLAGKHGKIDTTALTTGSFQVQYLDLFLSTVPDTTAFFGNRSIVVHAANGTRLNCGNFVSQSGDMGGSNSTSTGGGYGSPTMSSAASGTGAMSSPSIAAPNTGSSGIKSWSITTVVGMGVAAMAINAL